MRQMMSVLVMVMMFGAVPVKAEEVEGDESGLNGIKPHTDQIDAVVAAIRAGDAHAIAEASLALYDELTGQAAGSICVRGAASKPATELEALDINFAQNPYLEIPAGPSGQSGGERDVLMVRILEIEADVFGNCSASGIAWVAFTSASLEISNARSWVEWLNQ